MFLFILCRRRIDWRSFVCRSQDGPDREVRGLRGHVDGFIRQLRKGHQQDGHQGHQAEGRQGTFALFVHRQGISSVFDKLFSVTLAYFHIIITHFNN